jgi:hypothetical protein
MTHASFLAVIFQHMAALGTVLQTDQPIIHTADCGVQAPECFLKWVLCICIFAPTLLMDANPCRDQGHIGHIETTPVEAVASLNLDIKALSANISTNQADVRGRGYRKKGCTEAFYIGRPTDIQRVCNCGDLHSTQQCLAIPVPQLDGEKASQCLLTICGGLLQSHRLTHKKAEERQLTNISEGAYITCY